MRLGWVGLGWVGLDSIRFDWTGLDWTGLDCIALHPLHPSPLLMAWQVSSAKNKQEDLIYRRMVDMVSSSSVGGRAP